MRRYRHQPGRFAIGGAALVALVSWGCDGKASPEPDAGPDDADDSSMPDAGATPFDAAAQLEGPVDDAALDDAGAPDAAPDAGVLRLLSRVPEPDAQNVHARAAVVLEFSAPLDPATVTASAARLESAAGPIDGELQLSEDRRTLRIVPRSVPVEPTQVSALLSDSLSDELGRRFAGERWSWSLPLWRSATSWQTEFDTLAAADVAVDGEDRVLVAAIGQAAGAPVLRVVRLQDQAAELLAEVPLGATLRGDGGHALRVAKDGTVLIASIEQQAVTIRQLRDGALVPAFPPWTSSRVIASCDLALLDDAPVLAVVEGEGDERDARVLRFDAALDSWRALGTALDRAPARPVSQVVLAAAASTELAVAWLEYDGVSNNLYVARLAPGASDFSAPDGALDLDLDADVREPRLALGDDGAPWVLWREGSQAKAAAYVARIGERVTVWGGALDPAQAALAQGLALDARGEPLALLQDASATAQLSVLRLNGSPAPPFGLSQRPAASCSLPADDDPAFPATLRDTGCFADVPSRTPAPGTLPYSVNSPLWSDGALKRRFVVVPDGQTLGYREQGAFELPVGSVLVKEFLLQRTPGDLQDVVPMETRLLVKRCEPGNCRAPWQGYSYQWNDAGNEAVLLDNTEATVLKDWTLGGRTHTHSYPGRDQCVRCHATAAGGALGLQRGQLNRSHVYGEHVDNQLRALAHIGLFGASLAEPSEAVLAATPPLPSPYDPAASLEGRVRSYMHVNCSHCHRPDGRWPVVDLRFEAELRAADGESPNLCDKLLPGNAGGSLLYQKLGARPPTLPADFQGEPMPPLGTLIPDTRQLPAFAAWIDGMQSCP